MISSTVDDCLNWNSSTFERGSHYKIWPFCSLHRNSHRKCQRNPLVITFLDFQTHFPPKVHAWFHISRPEKKRFIHFWMSIPFKTPRFWSLELNLSMLKKPRAVISSDSHFFLNLPMWFPLWLMIVWIEIHQHFKEDPTPKSGVLFIASEFSSKMPKKSISNHFSRFSNSLSSKSACLISYCKAWKKIYSLLDEHSLQNSQVLIFGMES